MKAGTCRAGSCSSQLEAPRTNWQTGKKPSSSISQTPTLQNETLLTHPARLFPRRTPRALRIHGTRKAQDALSQRRANSKPRRRTHIGGATRANLEAAGASRAAVPELLGAPPLIKAVYKAERSVSANTLRDLIDVGSSMKVRYHGDFVGTTGCSNVAVSQLEPRASSSPVPLKTCFTIPGIERATLLLALGTVDPPSTQEPFLHYAPQHGLHKTRIRETSAKHR